MTDGHRRGAIGLWDSTVVWDGIWKCGDSPSLGGNFDLESRTLRVYGGGLISANRQMSIIHGTCSGVKITLFGCAYIAVDDVGMEVHGETVAVGWAIVGDHFDSEDAQFVAASWRHPHLDEWADRSPIPIEPSGSDVNVYSTRRVAPETLEMDNGKIALQQSPLGVRRDRYNMTLSAHEELVAHFTEPLSVGEVLLNWVAPTSALLSLCTGVSRNAFHVRLARDGKWHDLHAGFDDASLNEPPLMNIQLGLPMRVLGFAESLKRWWPIHAANHLSCETLFSEATNALPAYPRLMALASAAEGLSNGLAAVRRTKDAIDRLNSERAGKIDQALVQISDAGQREWLRGQIGTSAATFVQSLIALAELPGRPFCWHYSHHFGTDWADHIKTARNAYAHAGKKRDQFHAPELQLMGDTLQVLMRTALFNELGLPHEDLADAVHGDQQYRRLTMSRLVDEEGNEVNWD